jgi:O-succinylbenzoic acid--CoA ligase
LGHVGGLGVVTRALLTGTGLVVHARPDGPAIEAAAAAGATLVSLVPTVLARCDTSGFRVVLLGGASPPATLPTNVVTTWGMTETFGGVVYDRRPLEGVELAVRDDELLVRSPTLAAQWRDGTQITDADGWLRTGDAASLDVDDNLHVHGRLAEVIVTGGEKVWPAQVERTLCEHPEVADAVVVGRPDDEWGARVHAVVIAADPGHPPTLAALRQHVSATLPPWCAPRSLDIVAELPRLPSGKPDRKALRAGR